MEFLNGLGGEVVGLLVGAVLFILFIALMDGRKDRDRRGRGPRRKRGHGRD